MFGRKLGCDGRSINRTFGPAAQLILKPRKFAPHVETHVNFKVNMKFSIANDRRSKPPAAAQGAKVCFGPEFPFGYFANSRQVA